ncbi:MAG TPA: ectonucleotide pyrophosphatase/phosphodiesterase, partial [Opitutus sp.]|nr:ectonucleotide pyrophosphatase/phosphodiesterase [Opitutus sp.]
MKLLRSLALLLALAVGGFAAPPPLVLVSFDAFRWDYCRLHPDATPHLRALAREGVTAEGLISVFPSNTFPNHYSIVTGLYPAHHGIINNDMFDAATGEFFNYARISSYGASRWWQGEPIWVTTIKQGGRAGTWFWVGSEAAIEGVRPNPWLAYDSSIPFETRLNGMIGWLSHVPRDAPTLATFYIEKLNSTGHRFGPDSPELAAALKQADERIGAIVRRLREAHIDANLVIVSDHGMTSISPDRIVHFDDFINPSDVQVDFDGPVAGLRPKAGVTVDALMSSLAGLKHA